MGNIVVKYAVPRRINTGERGSRGGLLTTPVQPPDAVMAQVHLAHDLRNDMVELWNTWQEGKLALWAQHPVIGQVEADLVAAELEVENLAWDVKQLNMSQRSRARPRGDVDRALTAAKGLVRGLKAARKAAIEAAYRAEPDIPARLEQLVDDYKAGIKALYGVYCQQGQPARWCSPCSTKFTNDEVECPTCRTPRERRPLLFWPSFNAVERQHATAAARVAADRARGKPASLRFSPWDGTGTITVQLQREHGPQCLCAKCAAKKGVAPDPNHGPKDPPRSPELLAGTGGKWASLFQVSPWIPEERPRRDVRGTVRFRVGPTGTEPVVIPVVMQRFLPANADVCLAQLIVRADMSQPPGQRLHMSVAITAHVPDPEPPTSGAKVAVHVGWRSRPDGSVRVATWTSDQPLTIPDKLGKVTTRIASRRSGAPDPYVHESVVTGTGTGGEIIVPASWMRIAGRPAGIRSQRDKNLDALRTRLAEWLDNNPQPDPERGEPINAADVRRWKSPRRFVRLNTQWATTPPVSTTDDTTITAELAAWAARDQHLLAFETGERTQLTGRVRDFARNVGAWLADAAATIIVDDTNLAETRRRSDEPDEDRQLHPIAADAARAKAALTAPGTWRSAIVAAAVSRGVPVHVQPITGLGRTCPTCKTIGDPDPRYAVAAVVTCPTCGHNYDQDVATATGMLHAAGTKATTP